MSKATYTKLWTLNENALTLAISGDGQTLAAALLDGSIWLYNRDTGEEKRVVAHPHGASLSFCRDVDEHSFLSAGDDGRVVRLSFASDVPEVLATHQGKWIDHIAASPASGKRAYSVGKEVYVLGKPAPLPQPSGVGGLAFSPNGKRLAVSHYNGVSLWWTNSKESKPETLIWKGSHLRAVWHPAGDYIMTSMQENSLHGWRMKDKGELRMAGYPAKIHDFAFSARGKWLATSGADQIICWPFVGTGPQGKPPLAIGIPEPMPCTAVAPHPQDEMTAAGFGTGRVVLALFEDRLPVELLPPDEVPVVSLLWSPDGKSLFSLKENGTVHWYSSQSILNAA